MVCQFAYFNFAIYSSPMPILLKHAIVYNVKVTKDYSDEIFNQIIHNLVWIEKHVYELSRYRYIYNVYSI